MTTWMFFDFVGIIAFAISGVLVGLVCRMDIFGISVLAIVTTIGGGVMRDVLAGITPPTSFVHPTPVLMALGVTAVMALVVTYGNIMRGRKGLLHQIYLLSDTLGLAAFAVTGTVVGIRTLGAEQYVFPITLAVTTAVGGGILRDILAQRVPFVLRSDVYASAALAGSAVMCATWNVFGENMASWLCFFVVLILRIGAIRYKWQLITPKPKKYITKGRR